MAAAFMLKFSSLSSLELKQLLKDAIVWLTDNSLCREGFKALSRSGHVRYRDHDW